MNQTVMDFDTPPRFPGPSLTAADHRRLTGQMLDIFALMKDGTPRTLADIEKATGHPPASISAQLRHFRKAKWGSHKVDREHVGNGLYLYRLIVNTEAS